ncbi:HFL220Cp [Eremothecium sinecaudum]|uniref:Phosphatidylinositol N-acetylglucosaminyltransferase subunit GPI19 n=1 Tax=Eremothecium sinecaudum TaxID=45286 RepID=A0A0X8HUD8_9SACH|nr:HFL220Cp [Eremothecium sinecaudum]AMD21636.1 HFL220Cp [Eremothecium sinecaudum]
MPNKTEERPTKKYSGFVQSVGITCILIFIIIWSFIPYPLVREELDSTPKTILQNAYILFDDLVDLLPQRYWIICIQCMILMNMLFVYIGLPIFNDAVLNVSLDDLRTITDSKTTIVEFGSHEEFMRRYAHQETSGVYDIPITKVSIILHGLHKSKDI